MLELEWHMLTEGCSGILALTKWLHGADSQLRSSLWLIYSTILHIFWNPKGHYCFNSLPLVPFLSQINPVYIFPSYFFKVHFSTIFPSTPVCPVIFSSKTVAFLFFPIHATWPLSTSIYNPLRQTHMTWFVMEWRMKSFGSQKHLIWFWHFGAYISLMFSGKTSCVYLQPSPSFILDLPYLHLLPSFFLYFFTIFFRVSVHPSVCLSVCCTLRVVLRNYSESFVATKWCGCCFSSWLSCLQVLETGNVLAWFYAQQCSRLAQCIRDYTHFIVVCFTASSDWHSKRRSADTLWKYVWVY